ncbi:MAG: sugar phosphate isomerase/epimerase family protein [Trueperaceae bacterium]
MNLRLGLNGRFFANNWRPAFQEIAFASQHGFTALQFQGKEEGLQPQHLGTSLLEVGAKLKEHDLTAVMEILLKVDAGRKTASGKSAIEVLESNLPAIKSLGCLCVHFHFVPTPQMNETDLQKLEQDLLPHLEQAVSIATREGFKLGFENNESDIGLFATPDACRQTLETISSLGFVWDINHIIPEHVNGFQKLISRMTMLHVADTPLPEVNHHLPLGQGTIDFRALCKSLHQGGFQGPAILEIGGLPKSGGYGKDTDKALVESLELLEAALL